MIHHASRQQGMTLISFLILFVMIGFYIMLGLKLTPIYLEHFKVLNTLENLRKEPGLSERTPKEIAGMLQKRWDINGINRITAKENLTIESNGGALNLQVNYEVDEPIIGNVSALVKFSDSITVGELN
jgi:hypothetical protein